jgi:protein-tyrosine phosphatase
MIDKYQMDHLPVSVKDLNKLFNTSNFKRKVTIQFEV